MQYNNAILSKDITIIITIYKNVIQMMMDNLRKVFYFYV